MTSRQRPRQADLPQAVDTDDLARSNSLVDLAARINREHTAFVAAFKRGYDHALAAGEMLIEAKAQLDHGQWLPWLTEHCAITVRVAQLYMRVARHRESIESKCEGLSHLTLEGATRLLATEEASASKPSRDPTLNALGKPYSESYDPNYKMRYRTSLAHLCKPMPRNTPYVGDPLPPAPVVEDPVVEEIMDPIQAQEFAKEVRDGNHGSAERAAAYARHLVQECIDHVEEWIANTLNELPDSDLRSSMLDRLTQIIIEFTNAESKASASEAAEPKGKRPSNTVTDAQGHKWKLRFTQYQQGWTWQAQHGGHGRASTTDASGPFFPTREAARADARSEIERPDYNHLAMAKEFGMRLAKRRGLQCQLTAEDHEAIDRAGTVAQAPRGAV